MVTHMLSDRLVIFSKLSFQVLPPKSTAQNNRVQFDLEVRQILRFFGSVGAILALKTYYVSMIPRALCSASRTHAFQRQICWHSSRRRACDSWLSSSNSKLIIEATPGFKAWWSPGLVRVRHPNVTFQTSPPPGSQTSRRFDSSWHILRHPREARLAKVRHQNRVGRPFPQQHSRTPVLPTIEKRLRPKRKSSKHQSCCCCKASSCFRVACEHECINSVVSSFRQLGEGYHSQRKARLSSCLHLSLLQTMFQLVQRCELHSMTTW